MTQKSSHYHPQPRRAARSNPMVLGAQSAVWIFWLMAAGITVLIVSATFWLLTHTIAV